MGEVSSLLHVTVPQRTAVVHVCEGLFSSNKCKLSSTNVHSSPFASLPLCLLHFSYMLPPILKDLFLYCLHIINISVYVIFCHKKLALAYAQYQNERLGTQKML